MRFLAELVKQVVTLSVTQIVIVLLLTVSSAGTVLAECYRFTVQLESSSRQ